MASPLFDVIAACLNGDEALYCANKHVVEGFRKAMAIELAPHKVRVNSLVPAFTETPRTRPFFENEFFRKDTLWQTSA